MVSCPGILSGEKEKKTLESRRQGDDEVIEIVIDYWVTRYVLRIFMRWRDSRCIKIFYVVEISRMVCSGSVISRGWATVWAIRETRHTVPDHGFFGDGGSWFLRISRGEDLCMVSGGRNIELS